jgi:hypothetical protein
MYATNTHTHTHAIFSIGAQLVAFPRKSGFRERPHAPRKRRRQRRDPGPDVVVSHTYKYYYYQLTIYLLAHITENSTNSNKRQRSYTNNTIDN